MDRKCLDKVECMGYIVSMLITFEVTRKCSGRCPFCIREKMEFEQIDMLPSVRRRIEELLFSSPPVTDRFKIVTPLGDCTCCNGLIDFIKLLNRYNYSVGIVTNGILLHRFFPELLSCGIDSIKVSTAFDESEFKKIYGKHDHARTMDNIKKLIFGNLPVSILVRQNDDYKDNMYYKEFVDLIGESNIRGRLKWFRLGQDINKCDLPDPSYEMKDIINRSRMYCLQLHSARVNADGTIQACNCIVSESLNIGHVNDIDSFRDIPKLPKLKELKRKWFKRDLKPICRFCDIYNPMSLSNVMHLMSTESKSRIKYYLRKFGLKEIEDFIKGNIKQGKYKE